MSDARLTTLFFGKRDYDAETARDAAERLRAKPFGYTVTERRLPNGGDFIVETDAPYKVAIQAKQHARWAHRAAEKAI